VAADRSLYFQFYGFLFISTVPLILTVGWCIFLVLWVARASFAKDNLFWKRRGGSRRLINGFGLSLRELWRDLHQFREELERQAGRRPTLRRRLSNVLLLLAGALTLSPVLLSPFKDLEGWFGIGTDSFLGRAFAVALVLYLVGRRMRAPPTSDWSYRGRAWIARATGVGVITAALAITYGGARLIEALVDSGVFPSAQPYTVLAFLYIVFVAVVFYGWMFVFFRLVGVSLPYFLRAGKMGLPHALDRERRDPRDPVTVLRSFNDEAAGGETTYRKLEAAIEEAASVYGPAVTAALQGQLPAGEVARLYLSDATWKDDVQSYIDRSLFVLLIPGTTAGLRWEIDRIVAGGHVAKLILALLPTFDLSLRQRGLTQSFEGTPWERTVAGADLSAALAAYFKPDGGLVMLTSCNRDGADCQLAIHCAVHAIFRRAQSTPGP
jgi:hypothetical protein